MSADRSPLLTDPALTKLQRELKVARWASRIVQVVVMAIAGIITAVGTGNAHDALSHHHTANPWAWMLYPGVEAALIAELQISAHVAEMEGRKRAEAGRADDAMTPKDEFDWGFGLRLVTGFAAILLNVWWPLESHDISGAGLHSLGPIIQVFVIEALAHFRRRYSRIIVERLDAITALTNKTAEREARRESRTRPATPAVPGGVPEPVPGSAPRPYLGAASAVPGSASGAHSQRTPRAPVGPSAAPRGSASVAFRDSSGVDMATLREWAAKVDDDSWAREQRRASIRALRTALGIGQAKATELQSWLAKARATGVLPDRRNDGGIPENVAATSGDDSDSDTTDRKETTG
jgi:hypothetical protein